MGVSLAQRKTPSFPAPGDLRARLLRALVRDLDLTIVSNNCWGAHIYQSLGLPYQTPFVGMFILPPDYLNLLCGFDYLMRSDLRFVEASRSPAINAWRADNRLNYPIGLLGGVVEINFQHYADAEEARTKWQRRFRRMTRNPSRLFFKFDDRDGASVADLSAFLSMPLANKLCFTARYRNPGAILGPSDETGMRVVDGLTLAQLSRRWFNTLRWISALPPWMRLPSAI